MTPQSAPSPSSDPDRNIARWLTDRGASDPGRSAVKQGERVLSYGELADAAARFARVLTDHGVRAGDRVAVILPNVAYFPVVYYAILRLGAVVVPMNPLLKAGEVSYAWQDSGAKVAVVFSLFAEESTKAASVTDTDVIMVAPGEFEELIAGAESLTEVTPRTGADTAVILYTSGTTGSPKGAELSHDNLFTNVTTSRETLFPCGPGDVLFGGLPLFHSFGQTCALNVAISAGACLTLLPKFDAAEALRMVQDDKVTIFLGVPTMYMGLLGVPDKESYDVSTLHTAASGGASLPVEVLHSVEQAFSVKLLEGYGLSETSPVASFNHPDQETRPGSVGTPIRGVEFDLRDEDDNPVSGDDIGEIVIRGENIMKGYWHNPEATAEAMRGGWFHSGDLGRRDEDGFYYIVDRKKDMIIRNGLNVYPREVEEVLYEHPAVAEAAVFGVPDAQRGEEIAALVKLKDGAEASEDELRSYVSERIAAYKFPRMIRFGEIPKGPTGKILKREIKFD